MHESSTRCLVFGTLLAGLMLGQMGSGGSIVAEEKQSASMTRD